MARARLRPRWVDGLRLALRCRATWPVSGGGKVIRLLYLVGSWHGYLVAGALPTNDARFSRLYESLRRAAVDSGIDMWTIDRDALLTGLRQEGFPDENLLEVVARDVGILLRYMAGRGTGWHSYGFRTLYFLDGR